MSLDNYGLKGPSFDRSENWFTIVFGRSVATLLKTTQKTTQKLLSLIKENPGATREELARVLEITPDGVKYHLINLKKKGLIKRIGGRKGGYWEVVGE